MLSQPVSQRSTTSLPKADSGPYLVIAGNIGVGKSSLTERLATACGWLPVYEAVDENPYLADFYADMPRWGFQSQIFFLSRRLKLQTELLLRSGGLVQDRSVYEDAEVFAANLHRQGALDSRDYATYRALYDGLCALLPAPDLLVYLRSGVPTLLERINRRGRVFEQHIAPDYLAQLNSLYDSWIACWQQCPVLTIQADELDFVQEPGHLELIISKIQDRLAAGTASDTP